MKTESKTKVGRRDFLRALGAGAGVAARRRRRRSRRPPQADTETNDEKRKARYKETDHVKTFYRVNRYPANKEAPVLIKRTERQARRAHRRRRIGEPAPAALSTAAASCAAPASPPAVSPRSARCRSAACARRKPAAAGRRPAGVTIRKNICTHCSVGCTVIAEVQNGVWVGQEPGWDSPDQPRLALRQGRRGARTGARRPPPALPDEARRTASGSASPGTPRSTRSATS